MRTGNDRGRRSAAERGATFGAPTEAEVELAAEIVDAVPSVEKVRLVSSGTEASMKRGPARARFTRRDRVIKFVGCYHGHVDALLASRLRAGHPRHPLDPGRAHRRGGRLRGRPLQRRGRRRRCGRALRRRAGGDRRRAGRREHGRCAAGAGYLAVLRQLCDASGALLVFDEVITGFRVARRRLGRFGVPD